MTDQIDLPYFAYGSNLNQQDWATWCHRFGYASESMTLIGRAYLQGVELVFDHFSRTRNGGVLNLRDRPGSMVSGALFKVGAEGWDALNQKEAAPRVYQRSQVLVRTADGEDLMAITYRIPKSADAPLVQPHAGYVDIVAAGLASLGLDDDALWRAARQAASSPLSEADGRSIAAG